MLEALEEMHRNGLLHRDVKPANFAVSPAGYMMSSGENFEGMLPDFLPTQAALALVYTIHADTGHGSCAICRNGVQMHATCISLGWQPACNSVAKLTYIGLVPRSLKHVDHPATAPGF